MAYLEVIAPDGEKMTYHLVGERATIGRSSDNDLVLPDLSVSRAQAVIEQRNERCEIRDLGSRNGTFVDGRTAAAAISLSEGSRIRFGKYRAVFRLRAVPQSGEADTVDDRVRRSKTSLESTPRESISEQFLMAAEVQKFLLPRRSMPLVGYQLLGESQPCLEVGGDFFDYHLRSDGSLAMFIGDVARKGLGSALLGHYTQAIMRTALEYESDIANLVCKINRDICSRTPPNQFVSACLCVLDPPSGDLVYLNAGHPPPLLVGEDGGAGFLPGYNLLLGIEESADYAPQRARVPPGGTLVMYSDGVTEYLDAEECPYGQDRLARFLSGRHAMPPDQMMRELEAELEGFAGGARPQDDMTFLLLRRLSR